MFDTSNVEKMSSMFSGCSSLSRLELTSFDTSNVRSMACMFNGCKSLTYLNLLNFNTSNVTDMNCMFNICESLVNLDLTSFDTVNVEDVSNMFGGCKRLKTIKLSDKWKMNATTSTYWMFYDCKQLTDIDFSNFSIVLNPKLDYMFHNCPDDIKYKYLKQKRLIRNG